MAGLWTPFVSSASLMTTGSQTANEIFHNEVADDPFQSAPVTMVDSICTIITDSDDLWSVGFAVANEDLNSGQIQAMERWERGIWYEFYAARGPLVFRMKSKKTIFPEEKLWVYFEKETGSAVQLCHVGLQTLMVYHH